MIEVFDVPIRARLGIVEDLVREVHAGRRGRRVRAAPRASRRSIALREERLGFASRGGASAALPRFARLVEVPARHAGPRGPVASRADARFSRGERQPTDRNPSFVSGSAGSRCCRPASRRSDRLHRALLFGEARTVSSRSPREHVGERVHLLARRSPRSGRTCSRSDRGRYGGARSRRAAPRRCDHDVESP